MHMKVNCKCHDGHGQCNKKPKKFLFKQKCIEWGKVDRNCPIAERTGRPDPMPGPNHHHESSKGSKFVELACPGKTTPTLYGKDAKKFLKEVEKNNNRKPTDQELRSYKRAKSTYEKMKESVKNSKFLTADDDEGIIKKAEKVTTEDIGPIPIPCPDELQKTVVSYRTGCCTGCQWHPDVCPYCMRQFEIEDYIDDHVGR